MNMKDLRTELANRKLQPNFPKENIIDKLYTLKDYSWKSAGWKLKLATSLGKTPWGADQELVITWYKGENFKAVWFENRVHMSVEGPTLGALVDELIKRPVIKFINDFDVDELNLEVGRKLKERTTKSKTTKNSNDDTFLCKVYEKIVATDLSNEGENEEYATYVYLADFGYLDILKEHNKSYICVSTKASLISKELGLTVKEEYRENADYPTKIFKAYILRAVVETFIEEWEARHVRYYG